MQRTIKIAAVLVIFLLCPLQGQEFMPVEDVGKGMRGIVKTIFEGTEIVEVDAEVLGIVSNAVGAGMDIIVVQLEGERIEHQGVSAGMSGSPFYIDGKLVGALAYRLGNFQKDPIAGVTPISDMLSVRKGGRGTPELALHFHRVLGESEIAGLIAASIGVDLPIAEKSGSGHQSLLRGIRPIASSFSFTGLHASARPQIQNLFPGTLLNPVETSVMAGDGQQQQIELSPGSTVVASLINGDMLYAASGTVTHVDGEHVYAFGHPFNQYGSVNYFMHSGELVTVLSSLMGSNNLVEAGPVIGTITEDRAAAVYGKLAMPTPSLPLTVHVLFDGEKVKSYNYTLVNEKNFIPGMISITMLNSIFSTQPQVSEMSARVSGTFILKDHDDITFNNFFSSLSVPVDAAIFPSAMAQFLLNNDFTDITMESAELAVDLTNGLSNASLQKAWLTKSKIRPGESFELIVEYKPERGRAQRHSEKYYIPETTQRGKYTIFVGNGSSVIARENQMVSGQTKSTSIEQIIKLLNKLRTNDKIYMQTQRSEEGLYYDGTFFPNLPVTKRRVVETNAQNDALAKLSGSILDERNKAIGYIIEGTKTLHFEVIE